MRGRVVALFSLGGAPGVSTAALALAAMWPVREATVLVEADPSGGDVAAWRHMPTSPGLVELAAAVRNDTAVPGEHGGVLVGHSQALAGGQRVCVAPATADRCGGALHLLAQHPEVLIPAGDSVTVLDLGRLAPQTAALRLAAFADAAVLVVGDEVAQLKRAQDSIAALRAGIARLGVVVTGGGGGVEEIAGALPAPVWGRIPTDVRGAAFVRGEHSQMRPQRRPLMVAVRRLARTLTGENAPDTIPAGQGGPDE